MCDADCEIGKANMYISLRASLANAAISTSLLYHQVSGSSEALEI